MQQLTDEQINGQSRIKDMASLSPFLPFHFPICSFPSPSPSLPLLLSYFPSLFRLLQSGRSSAALWRSMSSVLRRSSDVTASTSHSAQGFADFFSKKIDDIRLATSGLASPPVISQESSSLSSFQPFTEAAVRRIIMTSPTKSCSLDPVPTFLLSEFIDLLLPFVTRRSMRRLYTVQGRLPFSQRRG